MPVAEIPESPIGGHHFAELTQVIDIEPKVCVVPLRCWSSFSGEKDRRDIVPPTEQIASGLDGPSRGLGSNCAQLRFPRHQEPVGGLRFACGG